MNCPFCNTVNDDENTFCVSCGKTISQNAQTEINPLPPTQSYSSGQFDTTESVETAYPPKNYYDQSGQQQQQQAPPSNQPPPSFNQDIPNVGAAAQQPQTKGGRGFLYAFLGLLTLLIIGAIGFAGFYFWQNQNKPQETAEVLPKYLGIFVQTKEKDKAENIKRADVANVLEEKKKLAEEDDLPVWEDGGSIILYSDSKEISSTDLKLIPLDSIKEDGSIEEIDFQVSPIEGKPAMKRLVVTDGVANGKYVFALLDGNLDDGKHKLWAFKVTDSDRDDNDDIVNPTTVEMKNPSEKKSEEDEVKKDTEDTVEKPAPTKEKPKPKPTKKEPPTGSVVGYCNASNVVLRGSPSLNGRKIGRLSRGQRLYVLRYSGNYDNWKGTTANWAYIQTEAGKRGWVFTPFVSY